MAIEFYKIDDRNQENVLLQIPDTAFMAFESVFAQFQKPTGIFIDPYGDTRIYSSQLILLNSLIDEARKSYTLKVSPSIVSDLQNLLNMMIKNEEGLLIIGE